MATAPVQYYITSRRGSVDEKHLGRDRFQGNKKDKDAIGNDPRISARLWGGADHVVRGGDGDGCPRRRGKL